MTNYAFIPFRSGSTRLKNKNFKKLKNRPLVYWTIKIAILSNKIDKVILSTDSIDYFERLKFYLKKDKISLRKIIFDKREKKFSGPNYKIFDYFKKILVKKYQFNNEDLLIQMLPTLPLRSRKFINRCIDVSLKKKINIFSANEYDFHVSFAFLINNKNKWKSLFNNSPMITGKTRGQDQKKYFHPNGLINCIWFYTLKKNNPKTFYVNAEPVISPKLMSFDIDNIEDFRIVKKLFPNDKI